MRSYGKLIEYAAGLIAIGAGISLIGTHTAAANSVFNPLMHGLGWYMVARGLWMLRQAGKAEDVVDRLDLLVDLTQDEREP